MVCFTFSILLYPYPYQSVALMLTMLLILIIGLPLYGIYLLIINRISVRKKKTFDRILKIVGISIIVLFMTEVMLSIIAIHHVNKQLGFSYATPETPEGELFEIYKVVPGKVMDKAGLKLYDQVQFRNANDLYRLLIENQGKEVVIPIIRDKKKMMIIVSVPELDVPLSDVSFLF